MEEQPTKKIYRILLAEDDHGTAEFVIAALERYNFKLTHASEGRTALRHLSESSFDLMLCDVMMPHVDGFKALETAREKNMPMPPIVMLTALHDQESVLRAKKLGAIGYLAKPCTAPQLLAKVKAVLKLEDNDLIDKTTLRFTVNTGISENTLLLNLVGCPVKNPMSEFIKAIGAAATSHGMFKGAQIQVGLEFIYAAGAAEHLKALAAYLLKSYHISKPSIEFSGLFFQHAEPEQIRSIKEDYTVTDF